MIRRFLLFPILLLAMACQEIEFSEEEQASIEVCGVDEPLKNLSWLKQRIEEREPGSSYCQPVGVVQGDYQGQTVYILHVSGALCCTCGNAVYDCNGEAVLVCNWEEEKKISNKKVIWEEDLL